MLDNTAVVAVVITIAVLIPAVSIVWWWRRGAPSVPVRAAVVVLSIVGFVAATAAVINHHYSYIPDVGALTGHVSPDLTHGARFVAAASLPTHGLVKKEELAGPGFSAKPLYVYLPPAYLRNDGARYPVLYLLHGSPGVAVDWIRTGKIDRSMDALSAAGAVRPFIIAMPDFDLGYARDTQCENIPKGPQMQTYLTRDVVSYVDTHFRTIANRNDRVIGGFSAGAYCGINLTMRHQGVFSAFVSDSGYTVPDSTSYTGDLFGGNAQLRRENSPAAYLPSIPLQLPLGAYLEAGAADQGFRDASEWIASVLQRRGGDVTLRIFPGHDHDWREARDHAAYLLRWASSWFEITSPGTSRRTPFVSTL